LPNAIANVAWFFIKRTFDSPETGAYSSLFAATSAKVLAGADRFKGVYLLPVDKITTPAIETSKLEEMAKNLWALSEEVVRNHGQR
jgi:hypothetical protein